jgi:hypothetical protein
MPSADREPIPARRLNGAGAFLLGALLAAGGVGAQSNCCVEHPGTGCDVPACANIIEGLGDGGVIFECFIDGPWSAFCVDLAEEHCASLCDPPIRPGRLGVPLHRCQRHVHR